MTSPAFSTGNARMTRKALTKIIQEKSGNRRRVICGARLQEDSGDEVNIRPTDRADPENEKRELGPVIHSGL